MVPSSCSRRRSALLLLLLGAALLAPGVQGWRVPSTGASVSCVSI